jgi:uncharacterized protein (TIGR04255 family)
MNEHIHPYKGRHSVKEAVISFYVQQSFVAPEVFRNLLSEDGFIHNLYQRFEPVKEVSVNISLGKDTTNVNRIQDVGFKFTGFKEGRTSKVIQSINQSTQTVFTFNELEYVSWDEYLPLSLGTAKQIAGLLPEHSLMAFNLLYIDEFYFDKGSSYSSKDLFNLDSRTLPKGLADSPLVDYHLVLNKSVGTQGYTDSLNIKVLDANMQKTIRIINSVTYPLTRRCEWKTYLESNEVVELLNYAHQSNKQLLNDILNRDIAKEIGVCVC